jgi:bifunctional non-homologous end joining protein LigD
MLATAAIDLPAGQAWSYEVKWDGYRALALKDGARVQLLSRNQKNLGRDFPAVVAAVVALKPARLVLDGEIVAVDRDGRPSFQALQHRRTAGLALVYYAFDLLEVGEHSLLREPLEERRRQLRAVVDGSGVLLSEPLPGTPTEIEREIRRLGLEGVVAKRRDSLYRPGERSDAWVKVKFSPRQEFVIGGYKPGARGAESFLVGYYDKRQLHYAAKVRAGLTPRARAELLMRVMQHPLTKCPFVDLPNARRSRRWGEGISGEEMKALKWVQPRVVIEVAFVEWSQEGLLRHPQFVGVTDDKKAMAVKREAVREPAKT